MTFALETILLDGRPALALATMGRHVPLAALAARAGLALPELPLQEVLSRWEALWPAILQLGRASADFPDLAIAGATPVPQFGAARSLLCAGANYYRHLAEMKVSHEKDPARAPFFFLKPHGALVGPGRTIPLEPSVRMLDWEVELTAVIGRGGRSIPLARALEHVAGYTVAIDVTARDRLLQPESIFKFDFLAGKGQDGYCPTAPGLLPAAFLEDPQSTSLSLWVNGVLKQRSGTDDMIYSVAELVSWASRLVTLAPGDLLLTGSPAGVGFPRGEFLKAGDVVRAELEGLRPAEFTVFSKEEVRA